MGSLRKMRPSLDRKVSEVIPRTHISRLSPVWQALSASTYFSSSAKMMPATVSVIALPWQVGSATQSDSVFRTSSCITTSCQTRA